MIKLFRVETLKLVEVETRYVR